MDLDHRVIITTCGRELLRRYASVHGGDQDWQEAHEPAGLVDACRTALMAEADPWAVAAMAPELNALVRYYQGDMTGHVDRHVLLYSEAWPDARTAELMGEWLRQWGMQVELRGLSGLREGVAETFRATMSRFTRWCGDVLSTYRLYEFTIIFNPAGGSRILVGFLQTLAPFYADESIHTLEPGHELVIMPMPKVQARGRSTLDKHLYCLRRLAAGLAVRPDKVAALPEALVIHESQRPMLSFFGELLWDNTRRDIYGERLLEGISERMILSVAFHDDSAGLERDRLILLNERVDQLARLLEQGETSDLAMLGFRPMNKAEQTKVDVPGATHHCHAWADKEIWHMVGHFEGERFVLDRLVSSRD
ncbi:MAG: hypothetical protein H7831_01160 [Magnetococcus sp. WYHC-3]